MLLITSDIHRNIKVLRSLINKHKGKTLHIDAGDSEFSLKFLAENDILSVKGNTDFFVKLPPYRVIKHDNKKILITHGHQQRVKGRLDLLIAYAKSFKCDICVYGHTHVQKMEIIDNIIFLNPGSLNRGQYAIYDNGEIKFY